MPVPPAQKMKDSKLCALMRSSALKKWSGISLPFPAASAEWEQEAASTLFLQGCKQWEAPAPAPVEDQLTQGVDPLANDNCSWHWILKQQWV